MAVWKIQVLQFSSTTGKNNFVFTYDFDWESIRKYVAILYKITTVNSSKIKIK